MVHALRRCGQLTRAELLCPACRLATVVQALCKARGLGGKDSRENLRQKLLKNLEVRGWL